MHSDLLLIIVVAAALAFDFTNGLHDTANVVACSISSRALAPRTAITLASLLNFAGAFVSLKVAATIATGIVDATRVTEMVVFAGLAGAILWNLLTWARGLPSSSSHALIGGLIGATVSAVGWSQINGHGVLTKVVIPALAAPVGAFLVAGILIMATYWLLGRRRPGAVTRGFRFGQLFSSSALSLAHGANDAQKTMGVITLALIAHGSLTPHHPAVPTWVVVSCAAAIGLGTYSGGWRILRAAGGRIIRMDGAQGFAAQTAGAAVILVSTLLGYPLSSTHVISGGVIGAGAAKRLSAARWGVAGAILAAWAITLPGAALFGAGAYALADVFGNGALGPLILTLAGAAAFTTTLAAHRRRLAQAASA